MCCQVLEVDWWNIQHPALQELHPQYLSGLTPQIALDKPTEANESLNSD